jgi:hypothetical protein
MVLNGRRDLLHVGDELSDFSDTAALISNLDLVISVDTSVAYSLLRWQNRFGYCRPLSGKRLTACRDRSYKTP